MMHVIRIAALTTSLIAGLAPAIAKTADLPNSAWHDSKTGWCLAIDRIAGPLPASDECMSFTGTRGKGNPVSGFACERQGTIGFFSNVGDTDNDIRPEMFVGTAAADALTLQYCARVNNDWPPDFDCKTTIVFKKVSACPSP